MRMAVSDTISVTVALTVTVWPTSASDCSWKEPPMAPSSSAVTSSSTRPSSSRVSSSMTSSTSAPVYGPALSSEQAASVGASVMASATGTAMLARLRVRAVRVMWFAPSLGTCQRHALLVGGSLRCLIALPLGGAHTGGRNALERIAEGSQNTVKRLGLCCTASDSGFSGGEYDRERVDHPDGADREAAIGSVRPGRRRSRRCRCGRAPQTERRVRPSRGQLIPLYGTPSFRTVPSYTNTTRSATSRAPGHLAGTDTA